LFKKPIALLLSILIVVSIISISTVFAATYDFSYDANGNLIQGVDKYYEYDSFNNLVKIRDKNSAGIKLEEHIYDHNGNRIKKIEYSSSGTATTYYPDSNFIRVVDNSGTHDAIYYYDDSALVGKKDGSGTYFYHPNHLGSTNVVTDLAGNVVERTEYLPFGEVLNGGQSRFLFTGKEKDSTGLMYYGARYYDPFTRHFTQADTVLPDIYDPLQLNRYAYTRNNPVKYTDPSGNTPWAAIGGVIGFGLDVIKQILSDDRSIFSGTIDYGEAATVGFSSAVATSVGITSFGLTSSALGSAGVGSIAGTTLSGIASGGIGTAGFATTSNLISGRPVTENVYESAVFGAEVGGVFGLGGGVATASGVLSKAVPKGWGGGNVIRGSSKRSVSTQVKPDIRSTNPFNVLHPNQDNTLVKSVRRTYSKNFPAGDIQDIYNRGYIKVHRTGAHSGIPTHKSNIHIDVGRQPNKRVLGVEKLNVDNTKLKDLYPLFEP
jgi:RHS repeat-associated protein